jgi:hypothetical protein
MFPDIFHISFSNKDENVYVVNHLVKMLFNLQTYNLENTRVPVDATDEESPVEMMEVKNKEARTI